MLAADRGSVFYATTYTGKARLANAYVTDTSICNLIIIIRIECIRGESWK